MKYITDFVWAQAEQTRAFHAHIGGPGASRAPHTCQKFMRRDVGSQVVVSSYRTKLREQEHCPRRLYDPVWERQLVRETPERLLPHYFRTFPHEELVE